MPFTGPIYIVARDRLTDMRAQVDWFVHAGYGPQVIILDNESSYPPLLTWYKEDCPVAVRFIGDNLGSRVVWDTNIPRPVPYAVTDPDIVPIPECPHDLLHHLARLSERYNCKAGVGLYLDDVSPPSLEWEQSLVSEHNWRGDCYRTLVDTTLAVYPAGSGFGYHGVRSGAPYLARHMSWYRQANELDEEHAYYLDHARRGPTGTSWGVS